MRMSVCLIVETTHSILRDKEYFTNLTLRKANVHTILVPVKIIEGFGHATIMLPNGTTLHLEDALLSSRSNRNLLSFQDIRRNRYHLETLNAKKNDFFFALLLIRMVLRPLMKNLKLIIQGCIVYK